MSIQRGFTFGVYLFFALIFEPSLRCSLTPGIELAGHLPPAGIEPFNYFDGSRCAIATMLRRTLMGLEINLKVRNLSNVIKIHTRQFSLIKKIVPPRSSSDFKLNPEFVTGFTDGESSFIVLLSPFFFIKKK